MRVVIVGSSIVYSQQNAGPVIVQHPDRSHIVSSLFREIGHAMSFYARHEELV